MSKLFIAVARGNKRDEAAATIISARRFGTDFFCLPKIGGAARRLVKLEGEIDGGLSHVRIVLSYFCRSLELE